MSKTTDVRIVLQFDGIEVAAGILNIPEAVMDDHDIHEEYRDIIGDMVIDRVVEYRTRSKFSKTIPPEVLAVAAERGIIKLKDANDIDAGAIRADSIGGTVPVETFEKWIIPPVTLAEVDAVGELGARLAPYANVTPTPRPFDRQFPMKPVP